MGYALAVARHRNFGQAADECFVTQPTLSMQLQKLEEEIGLVLFDRSRKPVAPTQDGKGVLEQFQRVLHEAGQVDELVQQIQGVVQGIYRLGIIPTMAPYILPRILSSFRRAYPKVELHLEEVTTENIIHRLQDETLDGGILATPLEEPRILEFPLFRESFVVFHSPEISLETTARGRVRVEKLDPEKLILMQEGHCLRSQTIDLCALGDLKEADRPFVFEAGSMTTLINMVQHGPYITVIPSLAAEEIKQRGLGHLIKQSSEPTPYRQVSFVVHRRETRRAIRDALIEIAKEELASIEQGTRRFQRNPIAP